LLEYNISKEDLKNFEEQKEELTINLEDFVLSESGSLKDLKHKIKQHFTIVQHFSSKSKIERVATCKTETCGRKAKIVQYGTSEAHCELLFNQHPHLQDCDKNSDLFKHPELLKLVKLGMKPAKIINEFNKISDQKLKDLPANRRKISTVKYQESLKENESFDITNVNELREWFDSRLLSKLGNGNVDSISWDTVFVADYEIKDNNFVSFITTKNLLFNIIKQSQADRPMECMDGTYKLNEFGHPTGVFGNVDLRRRFHLSIKRFFQFSNSIF